MSATRFTFPADCACCIPHDDHPANQLLAAVCPSPEPGVHYLAITQHHGKGNLQTRCLFGPVRVRSAQVWRKLRRVSAALKITQGWGQDNVTTFHPLDRLSKPAPSLDHLADILTGGTAAQ